MYLVLALQETFEQEKLQLQNNIEQQNSCHDDETKSMKEKLETFETENKELLEKFHALEEDLNEKTSNVKIVEKKSSALVSIVSCEKGQLLFYSCTLYMYSISFLCTCIIALDQRLKKTIAAIPEEGG